MIDPTVEFAEEIARDAGHVLQELRRSGQLGIELKHGHEIVTQGDIRSDRLIRHKILAAFPHHRVLSEEEWDGWTDGMLEGPVWVVDPLDGSVNFAHGHPGVAVSIAFVVDGLVLLGVVYAPFLDQMFVGARGGGAKLNGAPLNVSQTTMLADALVSTGFPHKRDDLAPVVERVRRLVSSCRDVRRFGSPAIDICWVAAGVHDAHTESLAPWDVAAAGLIAREAGAVQTNILPEPLPLSNDLAGTGVLISTPGIFDELRALLL